MYPPYWVSSKEGTFQWSGHFMLSLFLGSSDQRLKESKTDVNISIAFWVLMVQDNLLDIIFRMEYSAVWMRPVPATERIF